MSQSIRGKDADLCCLINPKATRTCYNALKFSSKFSSVVAKEYTVVEKFPYQSEAREAIFVGRSAEKKTQTWYM